ncbi:Two pore potassium channel protein sup-9 [Eumeta japonica]|uniref:Two pore potassium channel protein sup-9 n=1 Tax=Eumeta variegata TaxID=151549 RepID=A0A4C1WQZ0_EUMVA|nr:Two pore potassium channel protein sup-9 [Eumeta japonica]
MVNLRVQIKPVPIWLCVVLVASYIVAGTFLFKRWEGWAYLDAAYFCFITLTTIGFGDFVPAQGGGGSTAAVHSIALCSLYLLFGIALLAMAFNLVQEEVRANVAALATKLGIIKPQRDPDDPATDSDTDR